MVSSGLVLHFRRLDAAVALPVIAGACVPEDVLTARAPNTLDAALADLAHLALDNVAATFSGAGVMMPTGGLSGERDAPHCLPAAHPQDWLGPLAEDLDAPSSTPFPRPLRPRAGHPGRRLWLRFIHRAQRPAGHARPGARGALGSRTFGDRCIVRRRTSAARARRLEMRVRVFVA